MKYLPVTPEALGHKRWQRYSGYAFACKDSVAPLVVHELPKAALHLPLGWVQRPNGFQWVAILGLAPGHNLFVAPDGRWLGGYVPAHFRSHPFTLANTADGQQVLCVDTDSGLIHDIHICSDGEAFFNADGKPSEALAGVLNFLTQLAHNRPVSERICAVLAQHQLIQPWALRVQTPNGEQALQGLWRIDEARLNELGPDALKALQTAGALPLAYLQLMSMQHLQTLGKLAQTHAQVKAQAQAQAQAEMPLPTTAKGELDLEFLHRDGTLSFGHL
jgi:hypothetical protein